MKIVFVLSDHDEIPPAAMKCEWSGLFHFGVSILSACLKQEGHDTRLIHIVRELDRDEFISQVKENDPDLLAFILPLGMFIHAIHAIVLAFKSETVSKSKPVVPPSSTP